MKLLYYFIPFLLCTGCFTAQAMMNRDGYIDVDIGMSANEMIDYYGDPYQIFAKGDGSEVYEYTEKIRMGTQVVEYRRYYIVVSEGKVIGKYMKYSNPPGFDAIYSDDPYPNY